jgi:HlyD family type I secretion membrane fusion protein
MSDSSIIDWRSSADVPASPVTRGPAKLALWASLIFFGGFGGWAAFAPMESAAVAPGLIRVESHHRTVQHLEGGIVKEILVHDGDHVVKGQVLMRLSRVESNAAFAEFRHQQAMLTAQLARLSAERDGAEQVAYPPDMSSQASDPMVADAISSQDKAFKARREEIQQAIGQLNAEIAGHRAQIAALNDQLKLFTDEIGDVSSLLDKGLATKPRLLALQRQQAAALGEKGAEIAAISRAQQAIGDIKDKRAADIQTDLRDTQDKLDEANAKLKMAGDVDARKTVVAPSSGRIVGMKIFTPGGVIAPGEPILDIVPDADFRVAEAHVSPKDIDVVHAGLPARVVLVAYKRRITPVLDAVVTKVSADALVTENQNHTEYYSAEVSIDPKELARSTQHLVLYPGMPVEVMIVTGKRTLLTYLLQPVTDSFRRAFREE